MNIVEYSKFREFDIHKSEIPFDTIGSIEELIAHVGLLFAIIEEPFIRDIQKNLYIISGMLHSEKLKFNVGEIENICKQIEILEKDLPQLKDLILLGNNVVDSQIMICHSVARKVERELCRFDKCKKNFIGKSGKIIEMDLIRLDSNIMVYANKLSNYFFTYYRWVCMKNDLPHQFVFVDDEWSVESIGSIE